MKELLRLIRIGLICQYWEITEICIFFEITSDTDGFGNSATLEINHYNVPESREKQSAIYKVLRPPAGRFTSEKSSI